MAARRLAPAIRRFRDDARGAASIEFVVLFPLLMYIFFALGEIGTLMARQVMIERGVDIAVRDLRLGRIPELTHDGLKARICDAAFLLSSCESALRLDLRPLNGHPGANFPGGPPPCIDRAHNIHPAVAFNPAGREQIVIVRACLIADPIFPGTGLAAMMPRDRSGGYAIVVTSAFMNEPV